MMLHLVKNIDYNRKLSTTHLHNRVKRRKCKEVVTEKKTLTGNGEGRGNGRRGEELGLLLNGNGDLKNTKQ